MSTRWTGHRGSTSGIHHTQSEHARRSTRKGGPMTSLEQQDQATPRRQWRPQPKTKKSQLHPAVQRAPDRLRNNLARSCIEGVIRGAELAATARVGSTLDPELTRSREAETASMRSQQLCLGCQLFSHDHEPLRRKKRPIPRQAMVTWLVTGPVWPRTVTPDLVTARRARTHSSRPRIVTPRASANLTRLVAI